ncbi:uncharacterized protein LOC112347480 [Selaginella moellendorffii]|uniref:uncharacterized protein LOC112347480 n=1 Tax=Selaginella moellendorffii TaxID=88036 RepID=UPI000D1C3A56|nr:uncharacterized protein LOC112347480 [Selaginella moellendorffii]|eukprot:XP_024534169.1 uncharacterized protein LOC112347480 [Selaginella moellendorffii]
MQAASETLGALKCYHCRKMPPQTLDEVIALYAESYVFAERLFSQLCVQGGMRPVHVAALIAPGMFARPTNAEWDEFEKHNPSWTRESMPEFVERAVGAASMPEALNQGFSMAPYTDEAQGGERAPSSSTDSESPSESPARNSGDEGPAQDESSCYREDLLLYTNNRE